MEAIMKFFTNRSFRKLLLFVMITSLMAIPLSLFAGTTGKISGKIIDAKTGEPLVGVNILVLNTQLGAATDQDGIFYILNVSPGTYSVRASMIGYASTVQQNVIISVDQTTYLDFTLSDTSIESEEVLITATRPLVEKDVGASQTIMTTDEAMALPVSDIMKAVSLEPGITVAENRMEVSIRGGGSDQISFQVDGMERTDRLNNKAYTPTNSAIVQEIQVLKGGFNAEYGNLRSGVFNVVTKSGGTKFSGAVDYRMSPASQKHFGPAIYGSDQYDRKVYGGANSFDEVLDVEGNRLFIGWNALTDTRNAESFMGKSDWTPQELQEVWEYQTRGNDYADAPDHYVDFGISGPIGLDNAGFLLGVKYNRILPVFPTIRGYDQIMSFDGKVHFQPTASTKLIVTGLYGTTETTTNGREWGNQGIFNYGADIAGSISPESKYYLAFHNPLDVTTTQVGLKFTQTLSPSTFYDVKYSYFTTDSETDKSEGRNTAGVKTIGGVEFDEGPVGWVTTGESLRDVTGFYGMSGGGLITDVSSVKSHLLNFDMVSQVSNEHMLKFGLMFGYDQLSKDYHEALTVNLDPAAGDFIKYEETPYRFAGYIQDKIEYGGLIANIGVRIEHFAANGPVYAPDDFYSMIWADGGTLGYDGPADLPQEDSKSYTTIAPRLSFSHPVYESVKFFFNFGVYYSEPTTLARYGLMFHEYNFGHPNSDVREFGSPNLEPAKTSAYEVGFEQSIGSDWLIKTYFYSKDNSQQIGNITVNGMAESHSVGYLMNSVSGANSGYVTRRNNEFQTIRGIELKVTKRRGRFVTGWINMNYLIETKGNYGIQHYDQDPLVSYLTYPATKQQPQTVPSFIANINLHTPSDWGQLKGDWSLSLNQFWNQGAKYIYNPTNLPTREVKTIYYWVNNFNTNIRFSKALKLTDNLNIRLYLDINNLFNFEALNLGVLNSQESERYFTQYIDGESALGKDIGEVEDNNGNNVFTDNWIDKEGNTRTPIAPSKDYALSLNPRSFLFGIKLEF